MEKNTYEKIYGYKWIDDLIYYCSDPFEHYPGTQRIDRALTVLTGLLNYDIKGERLIENDQEIRNEFIDSLVRSIYLDNKEKTDQDISKVRSKIESIILNHN